MGMMPLVKSGKDINLLLHHDWGFAILEYKFPDADAE